MGLTKLLNTFTEIETTKHVSPAGQDELKKVIQSRRLKQSRAKKPWVQGKTFSPSSLTFSYCRRAKVAQLAGKHKLYYEVASPALQTVFDLGNLYHDLLSQYFWSIGLLKGSYECYKCDKIYHELVAPKKCPEGHSSKFMVYKEVKMTNEKFLLSGRADGILAFDHGDELVDVKSISNKGFPVNDREFVYEDLDVQGPKEAHIVQLMLYMFMSDIHTGHLLYISKNKGKIKTFKFEYDPKVLDPYLKEIDYLILLAEKWKAGKIEAEDLPVPCGKKDCDCHLILSDD